MMNWTIAEAGWHRSGALWATKESDGWKVGHRTTPIANRISTLAAAKEIAARHQRDRDAAATLARSDREDGRLNYHVRAGICDDLRACGWNSHR